MATLRLIKRRIKTTQNIAKITRAMEMVAALKMKRAQEQAIKSRPYTEKAAQILANLIKGASIVDHPLFSKRNIKRNIKGEVNSKTAVVFVTPSRGLCGSLNTNLFRELYRFVEGKDITVINYGKKGRDFITRGNLPVAADFEVLEPPSFEKAVDIAKIVIEGFLSGKFKKVDLVYTFFESTMSQEPVILPILPFEREILTNDESEKSGSFEYLFEPGVKNLLNAFLPHLLEMKIYHALLEAYASEQSARMIAMRSATENAGEITAELTLSYNGERQQVITNEISDIITAKMALGV